MDDLKFDGGWQYMQEQPLEYLQKPMIVELAKLLWLAIGLSNWLTAGV